MNEPVCPPVESVNWRNAVGIIRSVFPLLDLFEDIADPADWALLISAEQKTNPRLMELIGNLDLVPANRRLSGPGASFLMAPFAHTSVDRPSRFSDGSFGVLYVGSSFEVALFETIHHHEQFMARTKETAGWTSEFREIVVNVEARLHDLRGLEPQFLSLLDPVNYKESQVFGARLRRANSDGIVYASRRYEGEECAGLFYPDCAGSPIQGRHLQYHWNGARIDFFRVPGGGQVYKIV